MSIVVVSVHILRIISGWGCGGGTIIILNTWGVRACQILLKIHFSLKLIAGSEKMEPFDILNMGNIPYFHF